jgi:hypothetical protein
VGRRHPPLAASSSPLAASTLLASAALAAGPRVVGRQRPPLVTSSSLMSPPSSSRAPTSCPPLMAVAAAVQSTAASPLLVFLRGVPSAGSSLGVPPAISGLLTPPILTARGGLQRGDPKLFEIFISSPPFFLAFLRQRGQSHRTCGTTVTRIHLKDARCGVVDGRVVGAIFLLLDLAWSRSASG